MSMFISRQHFHDSLEKPKDNPPVLRIAVCKGETRQYRARFSKGEVFEAVSCFVVPEHVEEFCRFCAARLTVQEVLQQGVMEHGKTRRLFLDQLVRDLT